jgi:hypothetical protein
LTNQADQQHVALFIPDGLSGMTKSLPNLGQQEAVFVGKGPPFRRGWSWQSATDKIQVRYAGTSVSTAE